jgi:hypothetical protein
MSYRGGLVKPKLADSKKQGEAKGSAGFDRRTDRVRIGLWVNRKIYAGSAGIAAKIAENQEFR